MKTIKNWKHYLKRIGFTDFCVSVSTTSSYFSKLYEMRSVLDGDLAKITDILIFGKTLHLDEMPNDSISAIEELIELDIIAENDGYFSAKNTCLIYISSMWLVFEQPSFQSMVYFGDDTIGLLKRLSPEKDDIVLDLCSGPGTQAIFAARQAKHVFSVEINPIACNMQKINCIINDIKNISIVNGDLFSEFNESHRFDYIIANPPLLPIPTEMDYPFVGHGGDDGMFISYQILENGIPTYLNENGSCQIIGTTISNGVSLTIERRLEQIAKEKNLDMSLSIFSHDPLHKGSAAFDSLCETMTSYTKGNEKKIKGEYGDFIKNYIHPHLSSFQLRATRSSSPKLNIIDYSQVSNGLWFC